MILTAEFRFNGGYAVRRVATDFYYSRTTDAAGLKEFQGRIVGTPSFQTMVGCVIWGNRTNSSIGNIQIANGDEGVTDWLILPYRDCECILKVLEYGDSYDSATTVAVCIIDNVEQEELTLRISLRGKDTLLDRPIQPVTYTAAQAAEATSIEGEPIPIAMGHLWQIEPQLIDLNSLVYQFTDSYYKELTDVLSGGSPAFGPSESPDDYVYTPTGFRMLNTPSARITVNAIGGRQLEPAYFSQLTDDAAWTGNVPNGWTVSLGGGTITHVDNIGGRFVNLGSADDPAISYAATQGYWYFVVGEIVDLQFGGISVHFDTEFTEYRREGRFCAIGFVESGADITVRGLGDSQLTIGFLYVYQMTDWLDNLEFQFVIENICARCGLQVGVEVLIDSVPEYAFGIYAREAVSGRDALHTLLDSVGGYIYTDPAGAIRFGKYELPSADAPVITASKLNMLNYPTRKPDLAPGASTRLGGGRNWSPYTDGELAGITYNNRQPYMAEHRFVRTGSFADQIAREYSHALSAAPIRTAIWGADDTQTEADRITEILTVGRDFWEFTVALESAADVATIVPGANVLLSDESFGDDNGKKAKIVGVEGQYNDPTMKIICWGAI